MHPEHQTSAEYNYFVFSRFAECRQRTAFTQNLYTFFGDKRRNFIIIIGFYSFASGGLTFETIFIINSMITREERGPDTHDYQPDREK